MLKEGSRVNAPSADVQDQDLSSSDADSDFAPDASPTRNNDDDDGDSSSDSNADSDTGARSSAQHSRSKASAGNGAKAGAGTEGGATPELDPGDEVVVAKSSKKGREKPGEARHGTRMSDRHVGEGAGAKNDAAAMGITVKTRSMRAAEKTEEKMFSGPKGPVTIDVDALWNQMMANSTPFARTSASAVESTSAAPSSPPSGGEDEDMVRINREYKFAGTSHVEEKLVPRSSAEGRLHLASKPGSASGPTATDDANASAPASDPVRPLPRRAFRSVFEPPPPTNSVASASSAPGASGRADLDLRMSTRTQAGGQTRKGVASLNTVEKSRLDWVRFVDSEGLTEELDMAGRDKHSFATRQDFLARTQDRREDEARKARIAARVGAGGAE